MSLRFAILGTVSTVPSSGYDLARQFDMGLGWFWSASHSQIYPELKRLEDAGLVESLQTTVGEKLEKRVYSITDLGLEELRSWAAGPPLYRPNRDPERLQLIFSDLGDVESIRRHLKAHQARQVEYQERIAETRDAILDGTHERVGQRLHGREPAQQALTVLLRDLAYAGDIERAEHEIEWAEHALARIDQHEREHAGRATESTSMPAPAAVAKPFESDAPRNSSDRAHGMSGAELVTRHITMCAAHPR